jgi:hypothetical protein
MTDSIFNNEKFNKYSLKCVNFISTYFNDYNIVPNLSTHKSVNKIYETIKFEPQNYDMHEVFINKINNDKHPLIYSLFIELHKANLLEKTMRHISYLSDENIYKLIDIIANKYTYKFYHWFNKYHTKIIHLNYINHFDIMINDEIKIIIKKIFSTDFHTKERKKLQKLVYLNPFVSLDIHMFVESNEFIAKTYKKNDACLIIYNKIDKKCICNIDNIFHIIKFMSEIANVSIITKINILCSNFKKDMRGDGKILTPINVNSGSTLRKQYINLWRHEELEKVLIHELIHYYNIDFSQNTSEYDVILKYYKDNFKVCCVINPFEAYTEGLTVVINTIYICAKLGLPLTKVNIMFRHEILFSMFQTAKLLNYYGFLSLEELLIKFNKNSHHSINQTTSVLSYYIVKSAIIYNYDKFLDFIDDDIVFNNRIEKFTKLISDSFSDEKYIRDINNILKLVKKETNSSNFIWNTLRMTALQID